MFRQLYHLLRLPGLLYPRTTNPVEAGWALPPPDVDFRDVFYEGSTIDVAWVGWPESTVEANLQSINIADLWVTSFDIVFKPYTQLLTSNVDVLIAGSHSWTIDISPDYLRATSKYAFRFLPPGETYNSTLYQKPHLYSAGFLVLSTASASSSSSGSSSSSSSSSSPPSSSTSISSPPSSSTSISSLPVSSSSSSSPSSSTLSTSSTHSTTNPSTASATSISTPSTATSAPASSSIGPTGITADPTSKATSSVGLSTGAKAGIGIGCGITGIAVLALVYAFGRHSRNRFARSELDASYSHSREYWSMQRLKPQSPRELHSQTRVAELLDQDHWTNMAELPDRSSVG